MIANYLKVALRTLSRQKLYSVINVFGLSLGIACSILIILFVRQELSYDTFFAHANSIVRVLSVQRQVSGEIQTQAFQPMPLVPALRAEFPEIIHAARFSTGGVILSRGNKSFEETIMFTDPDAISMFDVGFIEGNSTTALRDPQEIVLTKEMARKYFGEEDPLGKQLFLRTPEGSGTFIVSGVTEPMPTNSTFQFDFLMNIKKHRMYDRAKDRWTSSNGSAYLQLAPGIKPEELSGKLSAFVQKYFGDIIQRRQKEGYMSKEENSFRLRLQPLTDVHLDTSVSSSPEELGNPTYSYILGGIALLVLTIACINFVTLAVGRSASRAKEVGMRKVLGAARSQLIRQFWGEAMSLAATAMILGLVLAEILLPTFNQLAGKKLSLSLSDVGLAGILAALMILIGIASGSYPALVLSRFEPAEALKGRFKVGGNNYFTKALVVFQFGLSIFLICAALVLSEQIHFLISSSLGFRPQQVAILPAYAKAADVERITDRFRTKVQENPHIVSVSVTSGAFTHGYDITGFKYRGENKTAFVYRIDENYLSTLGIPLEEGRNFIKGSADDRDHGMIVNEAFLRSMGWSKPALGQHLIDTDDKQLAQLNVIGVVKDFHFRSFREETRPAIMFMLPEWSLDDILIRITPSNVPQTVEYLKSVWNEINPNTPFNLSFMDQDFQRLYEGEMKWGRIVSYASGFAVLLACLGLFGLATMAVTNRTKEIGIRKVLGASGSGMVRLVSTDFLKLVLLANILAWPAAYLAASKYLEYYAFRISLSPLTFLAAGLGAFIIAFVTIAGQVIKAVRTNPVEALRYE